MPPLPSPLPPLPTLPPNPIEGLELLGCDRAGADEVGCAFQLGNIRFIVMLVGLA